jgi:NADH-quinone oxidoreductase subunit A
MVTDFAFWRPTLYLNGRLGDECRIASRRRCSAQRYQLDLPVETLLRDYFPILVFLTIAGGVATAMVAASLMVARQRPNSAKLSPYECGFEPFDDARIRFDVRYYLVAILFIIFDLEVAFLFPWAVSLGDLGSFGFWSMLTFLAVLTIGFIYEWKKGALEWE